eukprot:TRINITY_DN16283_c0_g3_i1.p1 TRINITY_DN16283_c0_g3~~TRINITY_DN16283_c0_g3_i1.p1  ORF type:complete len:784 (+),score=209.56 TRINITY_DN16283_c0_g3_i1:157-2508(+)
MASAVAAGITMITDFLQEVSMEITLFSLAFVAHAIVFGWYGAGRKNRGVSIKTAKVEAGSEPSSPRSQKSPRSPKAQESSVLAAAVVSLLKAFEANSKSEMMQKLLDGLEGKSLKDSEVQDLVSNLGGDAEVLVMEAAMARRDSNTLRRLLIGYPAPANHKASGAGENSMGQVGFFKRIARRNKLNEAVQCLKVLPTQKAILYHSLLDVACEKKDVNFAKLIFSAASNADVLDAPMYNYMVKSFAQAGDSANAKEMIRDMINKGFQPNHLTYNQFIEGSGKSQGLDSTWATIREMKAQGLEPNSVTCAILLKSIQKGAKACDTEKILAAIDALGGEPDEVLLRSLCEACVRAGHCEMLVGHLNKLKSKDQLGTMTCAHTIANMIRAYGAMGDVQSVWQCWRDMKRQHVVPSRITLGCMVEALAANNEPEAGYEVIQEAMSDPQTKGVVNAVMYCSIIKGFSQNKRYGRVWSIYEEMLAEKVEMSVSAFNALLDACARSGKMNRVDDLLKDMEVHRVEPNAITYGTVIKGYCNENKVEKALDLLKEIKKTTKITPDEVTYNIILDGCARYGQFERGLAVLEEMQACGVRPSNFTLAVVAKLATRSHKPARAFTLCEQLSKKYNVKMNVHVYNNLIQACTNCNDFQRALATYGEMIDEKVGPDARTYGLLLRVGANRRSWPEVHMLLRLAIGSASANSEPAAAGKAHPWKKAGSDDLHESLAKAISAGRRATLPKEGPKGLAKDMIQDVVLQLVKHNAQPPQDLLSELNKVVPGLSLKVKAAVSQ